MTFDPMSLLAAPPVDLTVDGLVAALEKISELGMGNATVSLPNGEAVRAVQLVAHGEKSAHFVLTSGPPAGFQSKVK